MKAKPAGKAFGLKMISLEEFGRAFVPERVRPHLKDYLSKAGIYEVNYKFFGGLFYLGLVMTYFIFMILFYPMIQKLNPILLGISAFGIWVGIQLGLSFVIMLLVWFYLDIRIYNRTKELERILPDFLQFVAGNLKGGLSFDRALWKAIRPRFGILANEIEIAAKKVMTGGDVGEALSDFTKKYDSPTLKRSFNLVVEGMRGGGEIVDLMDRVIENINETEILKKEMRSSVISYVIFISFIIMVVAPALFGLSFQLLQIVSSFGSRLGAAAAGGGGGATLPISFSEIGIDPAQFKTFSIASLGVIALFASMIVSIISRGDIRSGLKYVPVFFIVSIVNYLIFMAILGSVFTFI